jgi:hypothetical protein
VDAVVRDLVDASGVRPARLVADAEGEIVEPELIAPITPGVKSMRNGRSAASSGK